MLPPTRSHADLAAPTCWLCDRVRAELCHVHDPELVLGEVGEHQLAWVSELAGLGATPASPSTTGRRALTMAWSLLSAFWLLGCDPGINVNGRVVDPSGKPVEGADVSVSCPSRPFDDTAFTDSDGRFSLHRLGCLDRACAVVVRSPTGQAASFPAGEHCKKTVFACGGSRGRNCNIVELEAVVSTTQEPLGGAR